MKSGLDAMPLFLLNDLLSQSTSIFLLGIKIPQAEKITLYNGYAELYKKCQLENIKLWIHYGCPRSR